MVDFLKPESLTAINIKLYSLVSLAGFQMNYANGVGFSPIIQAESAGQDIINIPITKEIRYVSMAVYGGLVYTGLQLFDENHDPINEGRWSESAADESVWIEQEVPAD